MTWWSLVHEHGKLPVPNFSAGGVAIPADAALMRQLGAEAVFVGSGIFKSSDPTLRAKAMVDACTYYDRPDILAEISAGLGEPMRGLEMSTIPESERLADTWLVITMDMMDQFIQQRWRELQEMQREDERAREEEADLKAETAYLRIKLADSYIRSGKVARAIAEYKRAIKMDKQNGFFHTRLADAVCRRR